LARLFEKELSLQRRLELSRRDLALRADFSILSAFSVIDYPSTSMLSRDKLSDFLRRNGKIVFEEDVDALLRRMDVDGDERLSFSEFSDFVRTSEPVYPSSPRRSPDRSSPLRNSSPLRRTGSPGRTSSSFIANETSMRSSYVRASPLSVSEESELVNVFFQQISLERDLNTAKKDVALCSDFTLLDAFQMFDINDIGYVGEFDLEDTLVELGIRPTREEITLLFKHYSSLNNRRLTYSELSKLFSPKELEYSRILSNRIPFNVSRIERRRVFSADTVYKITRVLKLHLDNENAAESLRHRLARRPSFSMHEAFQAVDQDRNGYITFGEFQSLLEQNGIFATAKDVESLMDRYDKDKDGRVSYSEFLEEVTPKSPSKY
jgi:Ca2+-binding EF-hand superfamily protein